MARALSIDLRRRVIAVILGGLSCRQAAERFGISPSSAIRWYGQYRASGSLAPRPQGGDRRSWSAYRRISLSAHYFLVP